MARVNVYLPDELADEAREAGLNVSSLTRDALNAALAARRVDRWLDEVDALNPLAVGSDAITTAIEGAKDEIEGDEIEGDEIEGDEIEGDETEGEDD